MPPVNRLSPTPANAFVNYGPFGPVTSDPVAAAEIDRPALRGVGTGLANQLRGMYGTAQRMATLRPIDDIRAALASLTAIYKDPAIALQVLRQIRQRASTPEGAGEVLGELLPLPGPKNVLMAKMGGPEDFMRRREKQLLSEEEAEAKVLFQAANQNEHFRDIEHLVGHKDWLSQTDRRANVVAKLHDLGLPRIGVDPRPSVNSFKQIAKQAMAFDDPYQAYLARSNIAYSKKNIDKDFDEYIAKVREYRNTLNPRSKYDRETIKQIDNILGDIRVTQLKRD